MIVHDFPCSSSIFLPNSWYQQQGGLVEAKEGIDLARPLELYQDLHMLSNDLHPSAMMFVATPKYSPGFHLPCLTFSIHQQLKSEKNPTLIYSDSPCHSATIIAILAPAGNVHNSQELETRIGLRKERCPYLRIPFLRIIERLHRDIHEPIDLEISLEQTMVVCPATSDSQIDRVVCGISKLMIYTNLGDRSARTPRCPGGGIKMSFMTIFALFFNAGINDCSILTQYLSDQSCRIQRSR